MITKAAQTFPGTLPVLFVVVSIVVLTLLWAEMFKLIEMSDRVGRVMLAVVFLLAAIALVWLVLLLT